MRVICIFLLLLSYKGFSQSTRNLIKDSLEAVTYDTKEKLYHERLLNSFKHSNYDGLAKKIISDIDFTKLKTDNLIFYYRNLCDERRGVLMYDEDICKINNENPAYNQSHFWSKKNIKYIIKNYQKNIIPFLQRGDIFISDSEDFEEHINSFYFKESKALIDLTKRQKKGVFFEEIIYQNNNKVIEKSNFYYFPFGSNALDFNIYSGENKNFDSIYIEFANFENKIISVRFTYHVDDRNSSAKEEIYKTYQFDGKKWVGIESTNEYKLKF